MTNLGFTIQYRKRSLSLVLLTLLLAVLPSASAVFGTESPQTSKLLIQQTPKGKPNPIVVINRKTARKTFLLAKDEVAFLKKLQSAVKPTIASSLSPDGTTVVIEIGSPGAKESSFHFLNIADGSQVEIAAELLRGFKPYGKWHWRNANTAVAIAFRHKQSGDAEYTLVLVDRRTGKVKFRSLETWLASGAPVGLSPNTQKVLITEHFQEPGEFKKQGEDDEQEENDDDETKPAAYRVVNLTDGKELARFVIPASSKASSFTWSPDSTQLAFIQNWEPENSQSIGGESLSSVVTQNAMGELFPANNPYLQKNLLQVVNLTSGKKHVVQASSGDGATFSTLAWSPDAKKLLVQVTYPLVLEGRPHPIYDWGDRQGFRLYDATLQPLANLTLPELSHFEDEGATNLEFLSSDELIFSALNGMNRQLYYYNIRSEEFRQLTHKPGSVGKEWLMVVPNHRQVIFGYSSYTTPPELFRLSLNGGKAVPITTQNKELAELSQTRADPITFTLANGERFDGIVIQPADAPFPPQHIPMIVWQEGGPASSMTDEWSADVEAPYALLPNFGMAVLVVPLYGRYGFGHDRYTALYKGRNFGQLDIDAMAEIVQQAIEQGYTTSNQVGITGCSYGGYFTTQSITRHPKLYAAANPQCTLVDTDADWKTGFKGLAAFISNQNPYSNINRFQQDSPIYNASQVSTPLLVFHGNKDFLPISLMENFYWKVASLGIPARMIKFMGAEHGLYAPEYQLYAAQEMIQWFRTYLKVSEKSHSKQ